MHIHKEKALAQEIDIRSQMMSMLGYLGPLCLIPLALNRTDNYIRYHTRQGLAIWMTEAAAAMSLYLPVLGGFLFTATMTACVLFSVLGIFSIVLEKAWHFPFFGVIAEML